MFMQRGEDGRSGTPGLRSAPRSLMNVPGQPCTRGSLSTKPACVHLCHLHDAWVVKNVQQRRRSKACSSCTHLSARARLSLPPLPEGPAGRLRAALEVLTSVFHKTTAVVREDVFVCGCPKYSMAAVCTNMKAATNICIKNKRTHHQPRLALLCSPSFT